MYSVSSKYKEAIQKSNPSYLTGLITFKNGSTRELTMSDIVLGGPSITMQAVTQDVLEFGAAVLGQLDISVRTNKHESRYKYYDGVVTLSFHIETEDGVETIPLGQYIITEAEKENSALKLVAYDNLFKFDKDYSLSLIGTPFELMSTFAEDCGCELAENEDYYKSLPNGTRMLTINAGSSCNTYRQAASVVGQMCGGFLQADRHGKISFRQFSTTENGVLTTAQRYTSTIADYVCKYVDLVVAGLGGTFRAVSENVTEGMTMYMEDAPAWDYGLEEVLQEEADTLIAYLDNVQYTPCELVIISDPSIDCGDLITLETDNGNVQTIITSYTWTFHGQMELQSVGKNPYLLNNSANKQRVLRDLEVNGGGGGSPQVLYTFKNIRKFKCIDRLESVAQVTFVASQDTFVMFDATFQVDVEVDDVTNTSTFTILDSNGTSKTYEVPYTRNGYVNITIQYYFNSLPFANPYTITLEKGSHVITLHYPISSINKDSINRFDVRMSATGGTVTLAKEMFMGTISGQGLAGKPKWDGTINVNEEVPIITSNINISDFNDYMEITKQHPTDSPIREAFGFIVPRINILDTNATIGFAYVVTNYTLDSAKVTKYEFEDRYVEVTDGYSLRTLYRYPFTEQYIDSGRVCSVTIPTTDKSVVNSLEVL